MKEVIVYDNRKVDPIVFDASTDEKEREAFLGLFGVLDNWNVFEFEHRIEKARKEIQWLEGALESADGSGEVWLKTSPDRATSMSVGEAERKLEEAERELDKLQTYKELYEEASEGDADAAKAVAKWAKRNSGPSRYSFWQRLEVQNG